MTTLQDRSEPDGSAGSHVVDAHCPHCGGRMASAVALPWPDEPTPCPSCERWVGRARAVPGEATEGVERGPEANGGSSGRAATTASKSGRPGRPGSTERRRARELAARRGDPQGAPGSAVAAPATTPAEDDAPAEAVPVPNGGDVAAGAVPNATSGRPADDAGATAVAGDGPAVDDAAIAEDAPAEGEEAAGLPDQAAPTGNGASPPPADDALASAEPTGEPDHRPEPSHTLPFEALVEEPERRRRFRLPRLRRGSAGAPRADRPHRSRILRALPFVLLVIGGLLLVEGAVTVLWKEPFSALFAAQSQGELGDKLKQLEEQAAAEEARNRKQLARYQSRRAVQVNRSAAPGEPIGRLRIPKLDLTKVVVQSTTDASLQKGPAHYTETPLPGQRGNWTVGIAGHRTTYDAPFRHINKLKRGDKILFTLPYGRFTYEVSKTRIVDDSYTKAFVPQGKDMIALTACHPLYSAAQRILVYGALTKAEPRGGGKRAAQGS